ncbi:MAG: Gfo/Idh/MocA family protein [Egibacteraceae bacterium]
MRPLQAGPLRAGVLGLGEMGRHHARVLSQLEGVTLVGVADPQGDRFGCANGLSCLDSLDQLLTLGLDLCVVAVPTADHEAAGLRLAAAGVHTLVEKPLAENRVAAERLASAFEAAGLVGCVGHIERYNPALRLLRSKLEAGALGAVYQVATRRQGPFPQRIRDVGAVKDLATHDLDVTTFLAGARFAAVSARTVYARATEHEDLVAATGLLDDGTVTNHLVNWITPMRERVTTVTGERGCFVADTLTGDLELYTNGQRIRYDLSKPEPLYTQLASFRDAVRDGSGQIVRMREGLAALEVAQACIESAAKGITVDLSGFLHPERRRSTT